MTPLPNISTQHQITILRYPNYVIFAIPNSVTTMFIILHSLSIPPDPCRLKAWNLRPPIGDFKIKGCSAKKLFEEFPKLKKRYWGKHFWARGYFCLTVGQMTEEIQTAVNKLNHRPRKREDIKCLTSYSRGSQRYCWLHKQLHLHI